MWVKIYLYMKWHFWYPSLCMHQFTVCLLHLLQEINSTIRKTVLLNTFVKHHKNGGFLFSSGIRNITLMTFLIGLTTKWVTATKWEITHGINVTFYKLCISTGFTSYTFRSIVVEGCLLELPLKTDLRFLLPLYI